MTPIDLLLWRHAEAESGTDDLARPLTEEGKAQAKRVAAWLTRYAPKKLRLIASPALRSQQTLAAYNSRYEINDAIAPDTTVGRVLTLLGWPEPKESFLIVGHQPWIGQTAAYLLTQSPLPWSFPRASLWWFRIRSHHAYPVQLRTVIHPDLTDLS
ncbi:MAG: histidine phosphatase family protein [Hydrogenophilus sp.]|nr:histidine phosphatase family protein [Hydrogenophilus sp.]